MSFLHKKKSQNFWVTIMPFGPVTNFLLAQKKKILVSQRLALISGTDRGPSKNASYQVLIQSGFRGDNFLEINQSETRIVCGGHV